MKTDARGRSIAPGAVLLAVALLAAGCGRGDGVTRLPLYGTVLLPGGEGLNGTITFLPAAGHDGPAAVGSVVNGTYCFTRINGPAAGSHRVLVERVIPKVQRLETRGQRAGPAGKPGSPPAKTASAGTSKMDWALSRDLPAQGPYQCDFTLEP